MRLPEATERTAIWTGVWVGVLALTYLAIVPSLKDPSHEEYFRLSIFLATLIPIIPFVFGMNRTEEGSWKGQFTSMANSTMSLIKRGLFFLFGAAAVAVPGTLILAYIIGAA